MPYLKASVSQEFIKKNPVRLNERWNFNDGISGTTGNYGAGVNVQLTRDAALFTEVSYQKGRHIESPVTGNLGFRISF